MRSPLAITTSRDQAVVAKVIINLLTHIHLILLSVSCNFNCGLCPGWSQSTADVFNWTRGTGNTPSTDTGPSSEHTSESGLHILFSHGISLHTFL